MTISFTPPVIGHRGACGSAPENTMSSFTLAVLLGIPWVEFDVMLAACGTPIIFHDESLERTTNGHGYVGDYTYTYLRTLDAGSWFDASFSGERIPTLAQLAAFLVETGLRANVEIKPLPGQDEQTVIETLKVLSAYFPENSPSLLFSSFSIPTLRYLRSVAPHCNMGLLMHEWLPDWRQLAESLNCMTVHVNNELLTEAVMKELKAAGKPVLSYTVNEAGRANTLFAWGLSAVFSDYPDRIFP
jgi:glycerophosphoryl diester phosphodiesterase